MEQPQARGTKRRSKLFIYFFRGAVGTTGAVIVYYFLLSGIVESQIFPKFQEMQLHQSFAPSNRREEGIAPLRLILPNKEMALLVVWSFLDGFSKRLVPSMLQSTEARMA